VLYFSSKLVLAQADTYHVLNQVQIFIYVDGTKQIVSDHSSEMPAIKSAFDRTVENPVVRNYKYRIV
jgi:hypothetical protein